MRSEYLLIFRENIDYTWLEDFDDCWNKCEQPTFYCHIPLNYINSNAMIYM